MSCAEPDATKGPKQITVTEDSSKAETIRVRGVSIDLLMLLMELIHSCISLHFDMLSN